MFSLSLSLSPVVASLGVSSLGVNNVHDILQEAKAERHNKLLSTLINLYLGVNVSLFYGL